MWKEYLKFLHVQIAIQTAKRRLVEVEGIPLKNFVVQNSNFDLVFGEIYNEMYEAMVKRNHSVMTLGWHNDK